MVQEDAESLVCIKDVSMTAHVPLVQSPIYSFQQYGDDYWDVLDGNKGLLTATLKMAAGQGHG